MLIPITAHLGFKRQPTPIDLPESWLGLFRRPDAASPSAAEIIGIDASPKALPIGFSLRRKKEGAEIWLHFSNGFRMNMSYELGFPKTFKDARQIMASWSVAHASPFRELHP